MVQRQRLTYDPSATYEVTIFDVNYLHLDGIDYPATVYQPQGEGPFPGLLRVHGGAWNDGSRSDAGVILESLAACGLVAVSIDFRQAPDHPYPAQIADTNYAVRWAKSKSNEFNLDPRCFGGVGDSSGAHTMMLNAMRPSDPRYAAHELRGIDFDGSVGYVLALWGVLDPLARLQYAQRTNFHRLVTNTNNYFTKEGEIEEGNPQLILDRGEDVALPPVLIIQGTGDGNIPYYIPARFEDSYIAAGGSIQVEWFPELPHRFAKFPSDATDQALARMKDFIARRMAAFSGGASG